MSKIVMTFGTFDHFHAGHEYYLRSAADYGDELITVVARDETVSRVKGKKPRENESLRMKHVLESSIPQKVELGSLTDPYEVIAKYSPDILCFGYDQRSFNDGRLTRYLKKYSLNPKIILLTAFRPETYKSSFFDKDIGLTRINP